MYSMAIEHSPAPFTESNQVTLEPRALPSPARAGGWEGLPGGCPPLLVSPLLSTGLGTHGSIPLQREAISLLRFEALKHCRSAFILCCCWNFWARVKMDIVQKCCASWELLQKELLHVLFLGEEPGIAGPLLCWHSQPVLLCVLWPWGLWHTEWDEQISSLQLGLS